MGGRHEQHIGIGGHAYRFLGSGGQPCVCVGRTREGNSDDAGNVWDS